LVFAVEVELTIGLLEGSAAGSGKASDATRRAVATVLPKSLIVILALTRKIPLRFFRVPEIDAGIPDQVKRKQGSAFRLPLHKD
jgi:hypothetical protein